MGSTGTHPLLEVEGLTKIFGGLIAVNDIDLTVRTGSIHAVIGPNGSGKTTLINMISGLLCQGHADIPQTRA
jgi:ABC-type branched-subunit amino acid transport system ATPase component